jgi:glycosyltransferase involved in cell wall biosynthesis
MIDEMEAITAGGTERQILQMIALMRQSGAEMQLCVLRGTSWLTEEQAGCPVQFFHVKRILSLAGFREMLKLRRWIKSQRFSIVQTFFVESSLVGPVVARLAGVPIIIGSRRNLNWWMTRKLALAQRVANLFSTRLLANCHAVKDAVTRTERVSAHKVDVVYNGVDTEHFSADPQLRAQARALLGFSPEHIVIGNTATLRPQKGIEAFILAAKITYAANSDARFLLVGDGPLRPKVERMIKEAGLQASCVLAGGQQDVRPYLQAMDIAVLCSESEGFSNSILEYLASGVPAIVSDVGGNREALGPGGRVVPPYSVEALAREMTALAGDAVLRRTLSLAALEQASGFSIERASMSLRRYYEGLLPH